MFLCTYTDIIILIWLNHENDVVAEVCSSHCAPPLTSPFFRSLICCSICDTSVRFDGLFKKFNNVAELANYMNVDEAKLRKTLTDYNKYVTSTEENKVGSSLLTEYEFIRSFFIIFYCFQRWNERKEMIIHLIYSLYETNR